ncbi:unnamed protein product, partial [marine sediment metagenome]
MVWPPTNRIDLDDFGTLEHHWHSRWRVYPQDITQIKQLAAFATANVFGSWSEVIPLDTIPFDFDLIGICVCQVSAVTSYLIQLGYNT